MDLLRFLLLMPIRLVRSLLHVIGLVLRPLLGNVSWSAPPWAPATGAAIRRRPRRFAGGLLAIAVLAAAAWSGWQWYLHRPKPVEPTRISFNARTPAVTSYTTQDDGTSRITVHPLDVAFSGSAAPIEQVGKPAGQGITMDPALKGQWSWVNDRLLRFVPAQDWPVGAHLDVRFGKSQVFAPHVLMATDRLQVNLAPFAATFGSSEFYQDPRDPAAKKTIMPVDFNYPVDAAQFEKRIALALTDPSGKSPTPLKFSVVYDGFKLHAWVHSQPLTLRHDAGSVQLKIDGGVTSSRGGDGTKAELATRVNVPGLYSLALQDLSPTLVDNANYEPEQVLVTNLSNAVRGEDLAGQIKAWILPMRNADVPQDKDDAPYEWQESEVSDAVLRQSQPLKLTLVPTENDYEALQSFKYHAEPGQHIYVHVNAGLKSFGDYTLADAAVRTFTVPDYPKLVHFMADGSLLSLSGSKRISIVSRNVPGIKLEIGRVLPDQLQHLVSFNSGTYKQPNLEYHLDEDHIVERFEQKRTFAQTDLQKAHYEGMDLGEYLKDGKHGVFLLHLSSYDAAAEKKAAAKGKERAQDSADDADDQAGAGDQSAADNPSSADDQSGSDDQSASDDQSGSGDQADTDSGDGSSNGASSEAAPGDTRMVVVTDLGMLVKRALDGSQDVFVQSIHTGQPVDGASVSVLAVNGQTLYTANTVDGVVHFPTFKGLEREKRPVMYLVTKGDDLSFLPIGSSDRQLDYSRFDIGGERNAVSAGQLSAYLFSDRGIYRPGDLFHIGLIVRAANWTRSAAGIPLQAEIVDPRGTTVKQFPLTLDASGFGELSYTPAETAPTGTWSVNLYIVKDGLTDTQIGSTTVQVKEFLPDSMKVDAKLTRQVSEGWVKPDQLKALVDVQNLFGTPAADRRVEGSMTLRPVWPVFHRWPGYQFYDVRRAQEGYDEALQDSKTDEHGHAEFDLDLKKYADATYQLYFLTKAYEAAGGRSVAATTQALVSSNDWLIGYKAADDLDYIKRGSPRSVHLVAIDPQAAAIELKALKAQLIERRYVSVLTKENSGAYKYVSKLKETVIGEQPLTIPAAGLDYTMPTDKPGNYALVIRRTDSNDNAEVNRVDYSVAGDANVSRSLDRNAELQITLSKQNYARGEPVEIAIRAPYTGSGLITIERDKVYAHTWFHADTTSSVQHITVPADFEGNGYINVQYIRDPSSDEVFMSPMSYGVAPFSVNLDARRNPLTVDAPPLVKPGQTVTFKLHSTRPAKAVIFAVDEGILQVARYKLGDPLKFFFRKRMLEVGTSQILDLILPDFEKLMSIAAPGGDEDDAIGRQLNPFKRKRALPAVFWSGIVDVNGEKDVSYTVPDYFNGKLRVMAVSVSPDRVGTVESATTVRGDFVLSPNVPTTLAPGDEADVSVGVANNLTGLGGKPVPVDVTLDTGPQLQVLGNATQSLSLGEMREGVAVFRVKATDMLGSGELSFRAHYAEAAARQSVDLSVRPASPYRTQVDMGRIDAGAKQDLPVLRTMYDAYAKREAAISTLPAVLSKGLTSYLENFQHYCSEQLVSESVPRLLQAKWAVVPVYSGAPQTLSSAMAASNGQALGRFLDVLHTRQNEQGGFGVWSATPDAEPFVSAYAMHFLLEARDRGIDVPQDMLDAGNKYLRQLAGADSATSLDMLRQRAYAVYLLTRQGNVTTNYLAAVQQRLQEAFPNDWKNDLAAAWLAASYHLQKQDKEANQLIAGPQKQLERKLGDQAYQYGYYYDPLTRDASVLYLLAKYFPERSKTLSPQVMENIAWSLSHNQFNTLSSAMTEFALDAYATQNASALDKLGIAEVRADGSTPPIGAIQGNLVQAAGWSAAATQLRFANASDRPAWYVASQAGYDRNAPAAVIKDGIEIIRDYTDTAGKPLDKIALGQEIEVHLKIRATGSEGVGNVAIVDLLPGGFDPVIEPPPVADKKDDGSGDANSDGNGGTDNGDSDNKPPVWRSPVGLDSSTWKPEYADVREDRVVIYGTATPDVREFDYRIKASNAGRFIVPPAYGESMYDRRVQARSAGGGMLTVVSAP